MRTITSSEIPKGRNTMDRTWLALVTCLLTAACGSKKSARSVAEDLFTDVCDHVYGCCSAGEATFYLGPYTNQDSCVDRLVDASRRQEGLTLGPGPFLATPLFFPNLEALETAVSDGRIVVDGDALEACRSWLGEQPCNGQTPADPGFVCPALQPHPDGPCAVELLFRGQMANGDRCFIPGTTLECKSGLACLAFDATASFSVCGAPGDV